AAPHRLARDVHDVHHQAVGGAGQAVGEAERIAAGEGADVQHQRAAAEDRQGSRHRVGGSRERAAADGVERAHHEGVAGAGGKARDVAAQRPGGEGGGAALGAVGSGGVNHGLVAGDGGAAVVGGSHPVDHHGAAVHAAGEAGDGGGGA